MYEEPFNEKFTKDDLVKICFAVVYFVVEEKNEMKLPDDLNEISKITYGNGNDGVIEYISNYILKESLSSNELKKSFEKLHIFGIKMGIY